MQSPGVGKGRAMAGSPSSQQSKVAGLATHELTEIFSNQGLFFGQIWFVAILKYNNTQHTDCVYSVLATDLSPSPALVHLFITTIYEAASGIIQY